MRFVSLSLLIIGLMAAAVACGSSPGAVESDDQAGAAPSPTTASSATSTPAPETTASVDDEAPTVEPPPPFDPGDYSNGEKARPFIEAVGEERIFPSELMHGQPELPDNLSAALATEFLNDSRVVYFLRGLRDTSIQRIVDYCDNSVLINIFADGLVNIREIPGRLFTWRIAHSDSTAWNTPFIAALGAEQSLSFLALGVDGVRGTSRLNPPGTNGFPRIGANPLEFVRVFDNPGCPDPQPLLTLPSVAWDILGVGEYISFPEEIIYTSPRLEPGVLVDKFDQWFTNLVSFENLTGLPIVQYCSDHRGVNLFPFHSKFGKEFEWRIVDASHLWPNAIWIRYENYKDGVTPDSQELFFLGPDGETFRPIAAASNPECSIEEGLEYVETIRDEFGR